MAFGDYREDEALQTAWNQFCDRLKEAGSRVFKDYNPATGPHRADGFRFLTQNLGQAFDLAYETKDPKYPVIHPFCTPWRKLGGDSAEFTYQQAWIDGKNTYKISGNRGTARFFNVTVQGIRPEKQPGTGWPVLHDPFGDRPEANIFGHQLKTEWDGSFELYIGGEKRGSNWLPTTPDSRKLFIRQGFDRFDEVPVKIRIERVGMDSPKPVPTPEVMMSAMDWAGTFLSSMMNDWPDHPLKYTNAQYDKWLNQFPPDPADTAASDKARGRAVVNMYWEIDPDQALIIEFNSHNGLWSLTNMGAFFVSMDYLYRQVSFTPSRAKVDSDGKVRIIMCQDDPGYHNWLDNQGFVRGNITYRNMMSDVVTKLETKVVKCSDLAAALPPDTAKVTPEQRVQQMRERFDGIRMRYML